MFKKKCVSRIGMHTIRQVEKGARILNLQNFDLGFKQYIFF